MLLPAVRRSVPLSTDGPPRLEGEDGRWVEGERPHEEQEWQGRLEEDVRQNELSVEFLFLVVTLNRFW